MAQPTTAKQARAMADFKRMIIWMSVVAALMVAAALFYLSLTGPLGIHLIVATIGGVFVSVLLGGGLMAATFFSSKSGHDDEVIHLHDEALHYHDKDPQ